MTIFKEQSIQCPQDYIHTHEIKGSKSGAYMVLADEILKDLYPEIFPLDTVFIPAGEDTKTMSRLEWILEEMGRRGLHRKSVLYVVGGGTLTDVGGLAAGLYMRGIDHVFIPTTLLAMVDASIGGKCGINFHGAKNRIGMLKHPKEILADVRFLETQNDADFADGLVEALKVAALFQRKLWDQMRLYIQEDWQKHRQTLGKLSVPGASMEKIKIVERDFEEKGIRTLLNVGHTLGHALEEASDHQLSHGKAVAMGLVYESELPFSQPNVARDFREIFLQLYGETGCSIKLERERLEAALYKDKKMEGGEFLFPYIVDMGRGEMKKVDAQWLFQTLIDGYFKDQ
ncbi:MAG: 3-dehydroquinate synthase family protein [Tissierellia bacterium]|nr:3-dehydroquinate synthase family protein [Tissierellia bacterium]